MLFTTAQCFKGQLKMLQRELFRVLSIHVRGKCWKGILVLGKLIVADTSAILCSTFITHPRIPHSGTYTPYTQWHIPHSGTYTQRYVTSIYTLALFVSAHTFILHPLSQIRSVISCTCAHKDTDTHPYMHTHIAVLICQPDEPQLHTKLSDHCGFC